MNIERNEAIRFHESGTLNAVTRWIANHQDGIAEWFKNVRRQYQVDRANVSEKQRVALLLLRDSKGNDPGRIGLLDVGGATLEDVTAWSVWQDPTASSRGSKLEEEETQGNGGKAYMYRLFSGAVRILGVRDRRRNCKGFDGPDGSVERGTPGWIPTVSAGREVEISSFEGEVRQALEPYGVSISVLPQSVHAALLERQAFTLVEGADPLHLYKGRIDTDELIAKIVRHEQATLCLEQVDFYAIHNGRLINDRKKLSLPGIVPYPELDSPSVFPIPSQLPLNDGQMVSTTEGGTREEGRLLLHTSAENMWAAWKALRPRWQMAYRTKYQMIGTKPILEVAGTTPGAAFIYGTVELASLEPAYVEHGRRRPKDGPLVEALDRFIGEKIRELAQKINARRKADLDEKALSEVHDENRKLDDLKNRYLPNEGDGDGGADNGGTGPGGGGGGGYAEWGTDPEALDYVVPENGIHIGKGVILPTRAYLDLKVRDEKGHPVRAGLEWFVDDAFCASISREGLLEAKNPGTCLLWVRVKGTSIESARIPVQVWNVDHILLTPRTLEIPLGTRQPITAEVTDDEGRRSTNVILNWRHDADDQLIVRVSREGLVTGNRIGRTAVLAAAGEVTARIPVEIVVIPNPEKQKRGSGFPKLLLTGCDLDPATGTVREGDPDQPALWQEPSDFVHNVWWLNLQSPEAEFAFRQRAENARLWRTYHVERVIEMVIQVWMTQDFTRKGESQRPEFWASHLAAMDRHRVRIVQEMWKRMEPYITGAIGDSETIG
jgi:hypothetical protein